MPIIEIQHVPGLPKKRVLAPAGQSFNEWLETQDLHADVRININGRELTDDDDIGFEIGEFDRITIFDQPKGGGFLKGSALVLGMFTYKSDIKFIGKIMSKLVATPNASAGVSKTSPNNSIKGQTNIARNGEARPDNYGLVRAFPDLIQESLFEYTSNLKYVTEFMNFGLGRYDVSSIRYSESNLGSMAGASYKIYHPGDVIPVINEGYQFDDIDGQTVPGKNESGDFPIETAMATTIVSGVYAGGQIAMKIVKQDEFDYFMDLALPHPVTFTINISYPVPGGTKTENIVISADLTDVETTDNGDLITPVIYYNFTFSNLVGPSGIDVSTATINETTFILNDNGALIVGPFFSPVESTYLWIHTQSPLGPKSETNWTVTIWMVDVDNVQVPGTQQTFTYRQTTPHDSSSETFYRTDKLTPTGGYGRYAVQLQRTDNSSDSNRLKIEAIHAVNQRTNVTYPDDTLVNVTVRQTIEATSSRERKYNALIQRHVISYDMVTQSVDYTESASRKFSDIALHNWLIRGKQPENTIDIYGLYQIQAELDAIDPRLGRCDYTFDDEDVSLGARMETVCDAASVQVFWDDGVLSFTRDKKRTTPATVFNRSNTTDTGYSLSYEMNLPGGFDGVEVQYRNPTTNKQDFIRYRITGGTIVAGTPNKAKKFEMMYIRDSFQADERALRECKRLIYSRISAGITALADGEWVNVGDMVQVPDTYDMNQQAGYITARNGNDFDTSEKISFSGVMFVVVTDATGASTGRYAAIPRSDTSFGFTASLPEISLNIFDGTNVQSPSRYMIATLAELDSTLWTITAKQPGSDGTTSLSLSEYSDLIYP